MWVYGYTYCSFLNFSKNNAFLSNDYPFNLNSNSFVLNREINHNDG